MEDEKLLECVRKYELIYNLQHPKYMDSKKKDRAWEEIAEQLKQSASSCRLRWQALRDAYRRAINKKKGKSGQAAQKIKKWKYEDEMSFVAPFFVERKPLESVELTNDDEATEINNDTATEIQNSKIDGGINSNAANDVGCDIPTMDTQAHDQDETAARNKSLQPQVSRAKKTKSTKRAKVVQGQTASSVLMSRLLDSQINLPQRDHDELDRFFLSISETVKKFSPYLQAVAKNKIFTLVSGMELQQLAPLSTYTSSTASTNTESSTPMPTSPDWNMYSDNTWNDNNL